MDWLVPHEPEEGGGTCRDCEELFKLLQARAKEGIVQAALLSAELAQREEQKREGIVMMRGDESG